MTPHVLDLVRNYGQATAEALALLMVGDKAGALAVLHALLTGIEEVPEDAGNDGQPD